MASNGGTTAFSANTETATITVTAVNDAPAWALPGTQTTPVSTALVLSSAKGNGISVADSDAAAGTVQMSLGVAHGTLALSTTAGLSFSSGSNGSAAMTVTGTLAAINTALDGLVYTPTAAYLGSDALTVALNDNGNTGSGGSINVSTSLALNVSGVNVTNTNDSINGDTSSIAALLASPGGDGISLREAITAANNTAGTDAIGFAIAGTGVHTITLASALPSITGAVVLDGSTDDSFATNSNRPAVIIDGNSLAASGIVLTNTADGSTVRGLVVRNFGINGISIAAGSDGNTIQGNYVGRLTATGTDAGAGLGNDPRRHQRAGRQQPDWRHHGVAAQCHFRQHHWRLHRRYGRHKQPSAGQLHRHQCSGNRRHCKRQRRHLA